MQDRKHHYQVSVRWVGNQGTGTSAYHAYRRDHVITAGTKPPIAGSSDPAFRGDAARWNPEDLLVAALSACHKLFYLHLCADAGIRVLEYSDEASGLMVEDEETGGSFTEVLLRPKVVIHTSDSPTLAGDLHHEAHRKCFIANSVRFPVQCEAQISQ